MMSVNDLKKLVHHLHLDKLYESMKDCHNDQRGGFLIPATAKITDPEYERYRHLPINWEMAPITKNDLPKEFSHRAVKTVDMFRRKTIDLDYECMIYFDYDTGNIISCNFSAEDSPNEVEIELFELVLKDMHISSVHNHPKQYYSPPSDKNFEMLGLKFEDFEIISAQRELCILESCEIIFDDCEIEKIRENANNLFKQAFDEVNQILKRVIQ